MFKLSIAFATIAELTTFVHKMGADVVGGTITHDQEITPEGAGAPGAAPKKKGGGKKTTTVEVPPAAPAFPAGAPASGTPFGSFAPGAPAAPAAPQPLHIVPPAPAAAAPIVAPMAPPQAPVAPAAPVAPEASPERKQWNDACANLVVHLQTHGPAKGYTEQQLGQVMAAAYAEAGIPLGTRIPFLSDVQIQALYPILHKHVSSVTA